jgi:hypothetical protein
VPLVLVSLLNAKFQTKTSKSRTHSHSKHHSKSKKSSSRQTTPAEDAILKHLKASYVFNITDALLIDEAETALTIASPDAVETELNYKTSISDDDLKDNKFMG